MERHAKVIHCSNYMARQLWRLLLIPLFYLSTAFAAQALEIETSLDNKIKREEGYLVYKVVVSNTDAITRNDVTLTLSLPTGLQFRGYSALPAFSCSTCSGVESYSVGTLNSGESSLFVIPLYANSAFDDNYDTDMTISASVTHGSNATPVTNNATVTYVEEANILLKTTASNEYAEAGEHVTFEIAVGNIGTSSYAGSYISATIPEGASFVSASDGGSPQGSSVVWQSASILSSGSGEKRYFTVAIPQNAANGDVYKTAVNWARSSSLSAAQSSEGIVVVRNNNTHSLATAIFGEMATSDQATDIRFTVVNNSNSILSNATLNVRAGSYTRVTVGQIRPASAVSSSGYAYADRWTELAIQELLPGESTSILVPITMYQIIDGVPFDFHAMLNDDDGKTLQATHSTFIWDEDKSLRLNVSADKQSVEASEFFEYELSFGNLTDTAYQNVELDLSLPSGLEVISASDNGVVSESAVTWSIGTLSGRDSNKRTLKVKAAEDISAGELLKVSATLHNGGLGISRASEVTSVVNERPLSLSVAQIGDVRSPSHYNYLRYVVTNTSNITRTNITLDISPSVGSRVAGNDTYPAAPSSSYYYSSNWASYSVGDLAPGEEYILTVPFSGYQQTNGAPWVSDAILRDSISAFIQGTKPTTLYSSENSVVFTLATDTQVVIPGDEVTLEVGIGNVSDVTLQNLIIPLELPGELTAQSASNGAAVNGSKVNWEIGSLGAGKSIKRFITVKVDEELAAGTAFKVVSKLENDSQTFARASEILIAANAMPLILTSTSSGDTRTPAHYGYSKYVITNPSNITRTDIELAISVDAGERVYGSQTYPYINNTTYYATDWIKFNFDSIAPGESKVVYLPLNSYRQINGKPWVKNAILSDSLDAFIQSARTTFSYDEERLLSSHVSASHSVVTKGEQVTFEVIYGNESETNIQNLTLQVAVPTGLTVDSISDGGSMMGNTLVWDLSTLTSGYAAKRSFTATLDDAYKDGDTLKVEADILQGSESLSRSSESLVAKNATPLQLDVSFNQGVTRYTISNTDTVSHADVELILQAGNYTRFYQGDVIPILGNSTKYANDREVYEFGEIAPGETRVVILPFQAYRQEAGGISVGHAMLQSSTIDYVQASTPTNFFTSELGGALPHLSINASSHHVEAGEEMVFDVVLGNPSEEIVESAMLQVSIPSNATFESATGVYEIVDGVIYWPLGNMPAGNWHQLAFTLIADNDLVVGDVIKTHGRIVTNTATRTMVSASEVNVVQERPLQISATQILGYPLLQGAEMQISIGVVNNKLTELADVEVFYMPAAGSYVTSSGIGEGLCLSSSTCYFRDWVQWDLDNMEGQAQSALSVSPILLNNSNRAATGAVVTSTFYADHSSQSLSPAVIHTSYGVGNAYTIDTNHDSDGDGIPDYWELRYAHLANWLDASDADNDDDGDGYTNLQEYLNGLSPDNRDPKDTDFDGLLDSVEMALGLDPLSDDSDGDGLPDRLDNWPSRHDATQSGLIDVLSVGDVTEDGADDFALVNVESGIVSISVMSGADNTLSHNINWASEYQDVQAYVLEDINGNGSVEIGIFGMITAEDPQGNAVIKPQLFVKDSKTGNRVNVYNWSANWLETSLIVLDDITGDGIRDFGMQGRFIVEGARPQLLVKDAATGSNIATYAYPNLFKNPQFYQLSDFNGDGVDEVGLFGEITRNGKVQIKITDGVDDRNKLRAYNFASNWSNVSWHRLSDIDGDSVDDWGMFGTRKDDNKPQLFTKSGVSTTGSLGIYTWPEDLESTTFHIIPDLTSDGVDELAVGGFRTGAGRYQLTVRDGVNRSNTLVNYGWPSNWTDVSFEVVGDLTNDGVSEVLLFGLRSNGNYELSIKDGVASNGIYATVNLGSDWASKPAITLLGDTDFDGTPTILVYGKTQAGESTYQLLD